MTDKPPAAPRGAERVLEDADIRLLQSQWSNPECSGWTCPMCGRAVNYKPDTECDECGFDVTPHIEAVRSGDALQAAHDGGKRNAARAVKGWGIDGRTGEMVTCYSAAQVVPAPPFPLAYEIASTLAALWDLDGDSAELADGEAAVQRVLARFQAAPASPPLEASYLNEVSDRIIEMDGACSHEWLCAVARTIKAALRAAPGAGREQVMRSRCEKCGLVAPWDPPQGGFHQGCSGRVTLIAGGGREPQDLADEVRVMLSLCSAETPEDIRRLHESLDRLREMALPAPPGVEAYERMRPCEYCGAVYEAIALPVVRSHGCVAQMRALTESREPGEVGAVPPSTQEKP